MPDWQERITRETEPAIAAEHDLRYRLAAPLIRSSGVWADLGCGHGIAAAAALDGTLPRHALLVDIEEDVVEGATRELGAGSATGLIADLAEKAHRERVREALLALDGAGGRVVTCFEVVEHLSDFTGLIAMLCELAAAGEATSILSVPNDAFWSIENPFHATMWGEGAFEELLTLLPQDRVVIRQLPLAGSVAVIDDSQTPEPVALGVPDHERIPSHMLVAIGPRAGELRAAAVVRESDLGEQRRWQRQMVSDAAVLAAALDQTREELREIIAERDDLRERLRPMIAERDAWRTYIHDLEGKLGLPLSGSAERAAFDAAAAEANAAKELPAGDAAPRPGAA